MDELLKENNSKNSVSWELRLIGSDREKHRFGRHKTVTQREVEQRNNLGFVVLNERIITAQSYSHDCADSCVNMNENDITIMNDKLAFNCDSRVLFICENIDEGAVTARAKSETRLFLYTL